MKVCGHVRKSSSVAFHRLQTQKDISTVRCICVEQAIIREFIGLGPSLACGKALRGVPGLREEV
jgi:hypothetical protein